MNTAPSGPDDQLDEWIVQYLEAEETGAGFDAETLLSVPVETRSSVTRFMQSYHGLDEITRPLRQVATSRRKQLADDVDSFYSTDDEFASLPCPFGDFELLERLGQGGMGIVFKARQLSPRRLVAVKVTGLEIAPTSAQMQRFRNEAELAARLDHPGIVPVYEVGVVERRGYFSMKLLEGGDLGRQLRREPWEPRAAAKLIAKVSHAVHHAHQRGVLHRDLKPSNILLDSHGEPHVTDFGLARGFPLADQESLPSLTQPGMLIGTPAYMAPEQARVSGGLLTTATDVYGLGAVLYALLTGEPPLRGATVLDTLLLVRESAPTPPRQIKREIPRGLETICLKALARQAEHRYESAEELAKDLERWLSGRPIEARAARIHERLWRWSRRNPAIAGLSALAAGLLLLLMFGLTVGVVMLRGERDEALRHSDRAAEQEAAANDKARDLRQHLYAAQMNHAWRAWQAGDLWRVRTLLDEQVPQAGEEDLRGFEYYYLRDTCLAPRLEKGRLDGHHGIVFGVAYSPDGKLLATASEDRTAGIWDVATQQRLFTLPGQDDDQNSVVFHPNGQTLVTTSEDGFLWIWDVASGQRRQPSIYLSAPITQASFSPDGGLLAIAVGDGQLRLYSFPKDGQSAFDQPRLVIDAHAWSTESVSFSPDGKVLASSGRDCTAKLWDVAAGNCLHVLKHPNDVIKSVAFAHQLPLVATGSYDGSIWIWNVDTGELLRELNNNLGGCRAVAFAPDDQTLASCHDSGSVRIWDVASGESLVTHLGHRSRVWGLGYAPDGKTMASVDHEGHVLLWDSAPPPDVRRVVSKGNGGILDYRFLAATGTFAATRVGADAVHIVDSATGETRKALTRPGRTATRLGCSADGTMLAVNYDDGAVWVWDVEHEQCWQKFQVDETWLQGLALPPDRDRLLTLGNAEELIVWNVSTGKRIATVELDGAKAILMAMVGMTLVTGHEDGRVAFWNLAELHKPQRILPVRLKGFGHHLALSADGQLLAISDAESIEIWDADGKSPRRFLVGALDTVHSLAFSPDGRTLAGTTRYSSSVKLWHIATGQELMTIPFEAGAANVSFSLDGRTLFTNVGESVLALEVISSDILKALNPQP
jgi:WD40 repeat protein